MRSQDINPFIEATVETFETMCGVRPYRCGKLEVRADIMYVYDLIGILGLSGTLKGAVLMTMPIPTGVKITSKFLGEEIKDVKDELMDSFGEILNIIAGAATAKLDGHVVKLALPTVIVGKDQQVYPIKQRPWVVIPMYFKEYGKFNIEVAMEDTPPPPTSD